MSPDCCTSGETLIFTCAGAAYSGQVANRAGVDSMKRQFGSLFCTAAVGAGIPQKSDRARKAARRIAIDGCEDHCCRTMLEKAGMPVDAHVVVTDLGIEKAPATPHLIRDACRVCDAVGAWCAR
jgi:uncharacterized metal-binding protein